MQRAATLHSLTDETARLYGRGRLLSDRGSLGIGASKDAQRNTR
jgi:hypothetical protein